MGRIGLAVCAALLCGTTGARAASPDASPSIPTHGPPDTVRAIYATELAFEHRAETAGAAAAFRDFADPHDALQFPGGPPIRGAEPIAAAEAKSLGGGKLAWRPMEVFASTGDMGATWGEWSFSAPALPKPVTGRYVTVWRRTPAGDWKALMDIGTPDP